MAYTVIGLSSADVEMANFELSENFLEVSLHKRAAVLLLNDGIALNRS